MNSLPRPIPTADALGIQGTRSRPASKELTRHSPCSIARRLGGRPWSRRIAFMNHNGAASGLVPTLALCQDDVHEAGGSETQTMRNARAVLDERARSLTRQLLRASERRQTRPVESRLTTVLRGGLMLLATIAVVALVVVVGSRILHTPPSRSPSHHAKPP